METRKIVAFNKSAIKHYSKPASSAKKNSSRHTSTASAKKKIKAGSRKPKHHEKKSIFLHLLKISWEARTLTFLKYRYQGKYWRRIKLSVYLLIFICILLLIEITLVFKLYSIKYLIVNYFLKGIV